MGWKQFNLDNDDLFINDEIIGACSRHESDKEDLISFGRDTWTQGYKTYA